MFSKDLFSERLKELRKASGLKQSELAEHAGVTSDAISNMERKSRAPSLEVLASLAKFFDVSLDYLAGLTDNPQSHKS